MNTLFTIFWPSRIIWSRDASITPQMICLSSKRRYRSSILEILNLWDRPLTPTLWGWPNLRHRAPIAWNVGMERWSRRTNVSSPLATMELHLTSPTAMKVAASAATIMLVKALTFKTAFACTLRSQQSWKLAVLGRLEPLSTRPHSHASYAQRRSSRRASCE